MSNERNIKIITVATGLAYGAAQLMEGSPVNAQSIAQEASRFPQGVTEFINGTMIPSVEALNNFVAEKAGEAVKVLPKPAAWDYEPVVTLVRTPSLPAWPSTAEQAAALFGVDNDTRDPNRWEKNPAGGWHLSEGVERLGQVKDARLINSKGYLVEAFYDLVPGDMAYCYASEGIDQELPAQGATFWPVTGYEEAAKLQNKMYVPKWNINGVYVPKPCEIISPTGLAAVTVPEAQPATLPAVQAGFPTTPDGCAALFGATANRWKLNEWGACNLTDGSEISLDPKGYIMDGHNSQGSYVSCGGLVITKGGSIWNVGSDGCDTLISSVTKNLGKAPNIIR
jgi:hypothetical protein